MEKNQKEGFHSGKFMKKKKKLFSDYTCPLSSNQNVKLKVIKVDINKALEILKIPDGLGGVRMMFQE